MELTTIYVHMLAFTSILLSLGSAYYIMHTSLSKLFDAMKNERDYNEKI